ncbi:hypothetical protein [Larkinella arboricola]
MKTPERFNRAISALVNAYFTDTLAKGDCNACAVGNIVAAGYGAKVYKDSLGVLRCEVENNKWARFFLTHGKRQVIRSYRELINTPSIIPYFVQLGLENIKITGYSMKELARVEAAFERNTAIHVKDYPTRTKEDISADQYNGLMAVVDVLCKIEGIAEATSYKALFAQAA